jgi:hypothetical protein
VNAAICQCRAARGSADVVDQLDKLPRPISVTTQGALEAALLLFVNADSTNLDDPKVLRGTLVD